jgi:hypothetical protein
MELISLDKLERKDITVMAHNKKRNKIFISWSGMNGKQLAIAVKNTLEKDIFSASALECFVSTVSIRSGADWWNKIKSELTHSKMGIVCVTKENNVAPWIHYEVGAMVGNGITVIPLLFHCDPADINETPLSGYQVALFKEDDDDSFCKMIRDINEKMQLMIGISDDALDASSKQAYEKMKKEILPSLTALKNRKEFLRIYPQGDNAVTHDTLYISGPMSSISGAEYNELREFVMNELTPELMKIGFTQIYSPFEKNENHDSFEGELVAIQENFEKLKGFEHLLIVYPKECVSSSLIEAGYGLALCKKTAIFCNKRANLPYILKNANNAISHIKIYTYEDYTDILNQIRRNKRALFSMERTEITK